MAGTLAKQRKIQAEVDRTEAKAKGEKKQKKGGVQTGTRRNAVAPGPTWTLLNPADRPAKKVKEFGKSTAFRRPAQPEEVAPAYVFLASPVTGSYITGLVLPVIGGVVGAMSSQPQ